MSNQVPIITSSHSDELEFIFSLSPEQLEALSFNQVMAFMETLSGLDILNDRGVIYGTKNVEIEDKIKTKFSELLACVRSKKTWYVLLIIFYFNIIILILFIYFVISSIELAFNGGKYLIYYPTIC